MKTKNKFLIFCIGLVFCFVIIEMSFISASGLFLSTPNFTITQVFNQTQTIQLSLMNTAPYTFYNISIENNPCISFPMINNLSSGQTVNFSAVVSGQSNFIGSLNIFGYYIQNIGIQNKTWDININSSGVDKCSLTIINGDRVNFMNNYYSDPINLWDEDATPPSSFLSILSKSNSSVFFPNPKLLRYKVYDIFSIDNKVCTINCLSDSGYVNDPLANALLNLSLTMTYPSTTLNYTLLVNDYIMNFYDTQTDAFSITNTGTNTAKNISLIGDWFSFNKQNFDLNPGQSTTVVYTLNPKIGFTTDTNKTWNENFSITGNFPSLSLPFTIFINYANIDNGNFSLNNSNESLADFFCRVYNYCPGNGTIIIYRTVGNGSQEVNFSMTQDQMSQIWQRVFSNGNDQSNFADYQKGNDISVNNSITDIKNNQATINETLSSLIGQKQSSDATWFFFTTIIAVIVIALLLGYLGYIMIQKRRASRKQQM